MPLETMTDFLEKNQGRGRLSIFGKDLLITSKAEDVNYVLKENAANYLKGRTTQKLQILLGQGLVTAEGDTWRKQHRLIRPLMNTKGIIQLLPKMSEVIEAHYKNFPPSKDLNISKEMTSLTWKIVLNTLFSVDDKNKNEEWLEGILDVMEAVTVRTRSVLPIPFWVPTSKNLKMKKTIGQFNQFVYKLIKERKESTHLPNDLLTLLLGAKDQGDQMDEKQVRDEMITFLMAGHETVANSMTWLMILLSENPEYIEKLRAELNQVEHISNFEEKIQNMPLHRACVDESLRLYPPIWIFMRESISEDSFNSINIKKGTNVVVVPYASHRSAEYWDHPHDFRPERFIEQTKFKPGSYYPFGLGPRACIGFNFATYESVLILSYLVKHFSWKNIKPEKQNFNAGLTLRPTSNIEMKMDRV